MPVFWQDDGTIIDIDTNGCLISDFDQYGDTEAFGVHPDWQRQLSKFASVQDRLREWKPEVMAKIQVFPCMVIQALDIDAIRIDKSTQLSVAGLAEWTASTRACAANFGKKNFYITGEITGGDTFGSLYLCVIFHMYLIHRAHIMAFKWPRSYTGPTTTRFLDCSQSHERSRSVFSSTCESEWFGRRCVPLLDLSWTYTFLGNGRQS